MVRVWVLTEYYTNQRMNLDGDRLTFWPACPLTIECTTLTFGTDIHGAKIVNPNDVGDPLIFL